MNAAGRISVFRAIQKTLLLFVVALGLPGFRLVAEEPDNSLSRFVVSMDDKSEDVAKAKSLLASTLANVVPPKKGEQTIKTADGRYVLCGDLFHHGKECALVELHMTVDPDEETSGRRIGVGFAFWNGKQWEPRGLWRICPVWRPEGWEKTGDDYLPITPANKPFWTLAVTSEKPPLAIIVGNVWKYWQENLITAFDPVTKSLVILEQNKKAESVDGYLRLASGSRHRSTYADWEFCLWTGKKLNPKGYWYDGLDETEVSPLWKAASYDTDGRKFADYLIECNQPDCSFKITRNDELYAKVTINRPNSPSICDGSEEAYLFEKLTELPRKLCPPSYPGFNPKRLEDIAKITVIGDSEAMKKLSPDGRRVKSTPQSAPR